MWFPTEAGTPQGGPASPLLANVALHGLEEAITRAFPGRGSPAVVRHADDLVVLHPKREVIERCQAILTEHLGDMGLELKPSKTRITHTLQVEEGEAGFDFLGFNIRQYPTKSTRGYKTIIKPSREAMARHQRQIGAVVRRHRMDAKARLIEAWNPVIRGWSHCFSTVCSHETFEQMDEQLRQQLRLWIRLRAHDTEMGLPAILAVRGRAAALQAASPWEAIGFPHRDADSAARPQGRRSPYDGDEVYRGRRCAHHPGVSRRVARPEETRRKMCILRIRVQSRRRAGSRSSHPAKARGRDDATNWQLLHRYCHVSENGTRTPTVCVKVSLHTFEEPCAVKLCAVVRTERIATRGGRSSKADDFAATHLS